MWGFKFPNRDTAHDREPLREPLSTKGSPGVPAARLDPPQGCQSTWMPLSARLSRPFS